MRWYWLHTWWWICLSNAYNSFVVYYMFILYNSFIGWPSKGLAPNRAQATNGSLRGCDMAWWHNPASSRGGESLSCPTQLFQHKTYCSGIYHWTIECHSVVYHLFTNSVIYAYQCFFFKKKCTLIYSRVRGWGRETFLLKVWKCAFSIVCSLLSIFFSSLSTSMIFFKKNWANKLLHRYIWTRKLHPLTRVTHLCLRVLQW